ncbi:type II toxin-antitoxin system RelE/ParE family toxin [Brenneria sp. MC1SB4.1]|uniref:Type II toxin-antitoxin system RelE/ParE family toxin n=1 Tax=Brenneria tiliae TaxID=2914984 RepID=A0ABT0MS20_9GAMM|nr:type II toxin-antitoxin system RelE/ParE family toxin [Brenneria tiliae]MCL2892645.1 type II toxin-antitoxin system RelE/ParE family toxin [Brenneria tiliae]
MAIVDYISDDNPDAAQRLKDDIESKAAKLAEHPRLYRSGRVEGTRELVVRANISSYTWKTLVLFAFCACSTQRKSGRRSSRKHGHRDF